MEARRTAKAASKCGQSGSHRPKNRGELATGLVTLFFNARPKPWQGFCRRSPTLTRHRYNNAYSKSLFPSIKYHPEFSARALLTLRRLALRSDCFVRCYNFEHLHSDIRYVTPAQRLSRDNHAILAVRQAPYIHAPEENQAKWSGKNTKRCNRSNLTVESDAGTFRSQPQLN